MRADFWNWENLHGGVAFLVAALYGPREFIYPFDWNPVVMKVVKFS